VLEIRALHARGVRAERLRVAAGECVAVRGPSGAGKTLLLRAIADLDPCSGEVSLDGRSWRELNGPQWRRRVMLVPAEPGWWRDDVAGHFRDPGRLAPLLERLGLPPGCLDTPVARLSTGERQRLALARALELDPPVLLLDEPTRALDEVSRNAVEQELRRRLGAGTAIVLITHDPAQARRLALRCIEVLAGQAREAGTP
jgi:phosphate-transporting ATPase